ncbi:TPR repeat protein [Nitrospirillum viridazoti]|nr:TPR repeat protein [Nitrospirillum amazonense]
MINSRVILAAILFSAWPMSGHSAVSGWVQYKEEDKSMRSAGDQIFDMQPSEIEASKKAALSGETDAAMRLGRFYLNMKKESPDQGVRWLEIAYQNGSKDAMYLLGLNLFRSKNINSRLRGVYWLKRASTECGEPDRMNSLNFIKLNQKSVSRLEKFMKYEPSFNKYFPEDEGFSIKPNRIKYFERAALAGAPGAAMHLGKFHLITKDPHSEIGVRWLEVAFENGSSEAMYALGSNLIDFEGDDARLRAIYWLRRAENESDESTEPFRSLARSMLRAYNIE